MIVLPEFLLDSEKVCSPTSLWGFWREGLHCRSETMVLALWYTGCAYAPTLISKQRMITLNHYSTTSPDGSPKASLSVARED